MGNWTSEFSTSSSLRPLLGYLKHLSNIAAESPSVCHDRVSAWLELESPDARYRNELLQGPVKGVIELNLIDDDEG